MMLHYAWMMLMMMLFNFLLCSLALGHDRFVVVFSSCSDKDFDMVVPNYLQSFAILSVLEDTSVDREVLVVTFFDLKICQPNLSEILV
jgi:hypothetical protein